MNPRKSVSVLWAKFRAAWRSCSIPLILFERNIFMMPLRLCSKAPKRRLKRCFRRFNWSEITQNAKALTTPGYGSVRFRFKNNVDSMASVTMQRAKWVKKRPISCVSKWFLKRNLFRTCTPRCYKEKHRLCSPFMCANNSWAMIKISKILIDLHMY